MNEEHSLIAGVCKCVGYDEGWKEEKNVILRCNDF